MQPKLLHSLKRPCRAKLRCARSGYCTRSGHHAPELGLSHSAPRVDSRQRDPPRLSILNLAYMFRTRRIGEKLWMVRVRDMGDRSDERVGVRKVGDLPWNDHSPLLSAGLNTSYSGLHWECEATGACSSNIPEPAARRFTEPKLPHALKRRARA